MAPVHIASMDVTDFRQLGLYAQVCQSWHELVVERRNDLGVIDSPFTMLTHPETQTTVDEVQKRLSERGCTDGWEVRVHSVNLVHHHYGADTGFWDDACAVVTMSPPSRSRTVVMKWAHYRDDYRSMAGYEEFGPAIVAYTLSQGSKSETQNTSAGSVRGCSAWLKSVPLPRVSQLPVFYERRQFHGTVFARPKLQQ